MLDSVNFENAVFWEVSILETALLISFIASETLSVIALIDSALVSVTFVVRSSTIVVTLVAWFASPVVTFPNASLLTAELLVKAFDISTKFFADSSVSFDNASKLSANFVKSSFCLTTEVTIDWLPVLIEFFISSICFLDFFDSRKTKIVSNAVKTGFATVAIVKRRFILLIFYDCNNISKIILFTQYFSNNNVPSSWQNLPIAKGFKEWN